MLFIIDIIKISFKMAFCILVSLNLLYSIDNNVRPDDLFNYLYDEAEWEFADESYDSISLYLKNIDEINLTAMSVNKCIQINPKLLKSIIADVNNYKSFLTSASSLETRQLVKNKNYLDAYQHIKIELPFFQSRQYYFRMQTEFLESNNSYTINEWYLINPKTWNEVSIVKEDLNAIYLEYGAGVWLLKIMNDNRINISYRLIMDPGGSIPSFMKEMINKISVINLFRDVLNEAQRRS